MTITATQVDTWSREVDDLKRENASLRGQRDEWRKDFDTLCKAIVGTTGLSAIEQAHKMPRELDRLRLLARRLSDALLTVRPLGGSEMFIKVGDDFYADPDYCARLIAEQNDRLHEAKKEAVRALKRDNGE